jgi:DNA-binding NarL/FixJ family response regulator
MDWSKADMRILIVDDVTEVRKDLRTVLTLSCPVEIVGEAEDGLEAIEKVRALHPEVVLMDLEMPHLDGYQATQQIKAEDPACRVIALTIHGYEEARQRAFQAGVDAFVVKGEPMENLVNAICEKKE